ncbi:HK97 family phage prohead protease [Thermoanaerobacterium sp. R66]|uniref:HK97 family phage prohead protease n=1 Tax=Thermoanaerobacterium sp. R66 TaxID=2742479 RepID=UPI002380B61D|nr:HK97 family phage prohead protease [Thermoanaerobacterium sp. R66]MDE4542266.1 HK97 family phage prohead protease [Thermoanaerobacterium sp. R66]
MDKTIFQTRSLQSDLAKLKVRAEGDSDKYIEGYFIVYNQETELWPGYFEKVAPEAVNNTLGNDIRALINHDTTLVLGRNKAGTLELKSDGHGLWGSIKINQNDSDAMNLYERVKRGDVSQCSFGFNVLDEEDEWRQDGTLHTTLRAIDLHEVSVCTFPAYEETGVQARHREIEQYKQKQIEIRKKKLKERLRNYGIKTDNVEQKN